MSTDFFYIYALKDPRRSPAMPFYIGKGIGSRAFDHLQVEDGTLKSKRIKEIQAVGFEVVVVILADDLTENQALKLEAELISAFGVEEFGGLLTNKVLPSGVVRRSQPNVVVPFGSVEKAQAGLELLKSAIEELLASNPSGVTNAEAANVLGLKSDYLGNQKDYLTYSILGILLREGRIEKSDRRHVMRKPFKKVIDGE